MTDVTTEAAKNKGFRVSTLLVKRDHLHGRMVKAMGTAAFSGMVKAMNAINEELADLGYLAMVTL